MTHLVKQRLQDVTICSHRRMAVLNSLSKLFVEFSSKKHQHAYVSPVNSYLESVGVAETEIASCKRGRIRLNGSLWYALSNCNVTIRPGQKVCVTGRQGQTLLVELSRYT